MTDGALFLLLISTILGVIALFGNFRDTTTGRFTRRGYWLLGGLVFCAVIGASMVARQRYRTRLLMEKQRENIELRNRISRELPARK